MELVSSQHRLIILQMKNTLTLPALASVLFLAACSQSIENSPSATNKPAEITGSTAIATMSGLIPAVVVSDEPEIELSASDFGCVYGHLKIHK
jgi:hypothetical protein